LTDFTDLPLGGIHIVIIEIHQGCGYFLSFRNTKRQRVDLINEDEYLKQGYFFGVYKNIIYVTRKLNVFNHQ